MNATTCPPLSDTAAARTVAIAQEAARRLERPGHCAGYLQAALAGADRVKLGAAVALAEAADEHCPGVAA